MGTVPHGTVPVFFWVHTFGRMRSLLCAALVLFVGCRQKVDPSKPFRLAFFPNVTHAQALVGHADGTFARALSGKGVTFRQFTAGPQAMEALVAGSVDASYVGTGPAITAFLRAGRELRIIAGAVNGGAALVTRTARTAEDLKGTRLAAPQIGNTQDVALRHWLHAQGLEIRGDLGKGDVEVFPLGNAEIFDLFRRGELEGAWVPEPWASRLVFEAGGRVMVDEATLWPGGAFPTTVLVTTRKVLEARPDDIRALLQAHEALTARWGEDPGAFAAATDDAFAALTSKGLSPEVLGSAFARMRPTTTVQLETLTTAARHAHELGYVPSADLSGILAPEPMSAGDERLNSPRPGRR